MSKVITTTLIFAAIIWIGDFDLYTLAAMAVVMLAGIATYLEDMAEKIDDNQLMVTDITEKLD